VRGLTSSSRLRRAVVARRHPIRRCLPTLGVEVTQGAALDLNHGRIRHPCQCWTLGRRLTSHHWLSLLVGGHHHVCSCSHLRVPSRTGSTVVYSPSGEHRLSMSGPTTVLLLLRLIAVGRVAPLLALALCMFFGRGEQEWGLGFPEGATTRFCSLDLHACSFNGDEWLMSLWAKSGLGGCGNSRPRPSPL
jgi:hypothetical protein